MEKKKNRFLSNKIFVIFGILAILICLVAVFAPQICGDVDPTAGDLSQAIMSPSAEHPFGTDKMGRDIFARVIYGSRSSLSATLILVAVILVVGTLLGIISGYFGGWVDAVIAISLVSWPKYARLARSLVMKIRHTDFVAAAQVTGSKTGYMLWKYMLPNTVTTLVITAATDIGTMMMELAALSFLGFGAQPPTPEWGKMLNDGRTLIQTAPWTMIYPGLAIFITVVVFNMLGDSLRDILDPKSE